MVIEHIFVLGNRVLIEPKRKAERTQGSIIIPVNVNQNLEEGKVVGLGDSVINIELGDDILYPAGAGIPFELEGLDYKFIEGPTKDSPGNIIAVIQ